MKKTFLEWIKFINETDDYYKIHNYLMLNNLFFISNNT